VNTHAFEYPKADGSEATKSTWLCFSDGMFQQGCIEIC